MAARKSVGKPIQDPQNAIGKAYAEAIRLRAKAVESKLALSAHARLEVIRDLQTLAYFAEHHPEVFGLIKATH